MPRIHSFDPIVDDNSRVIILGSMPGNASLEKGQYYAHPLNKFWALIYGIFETPDEGTYKDKISFLKSRKIALWDVIRKCERSGSADSDIVNPTINDLSGLLIDHPNIKCILFNGRKAEELFRKNIIVQANIKFIILPSSSPAYASINLDKKLEVWKVIRGLVEG